MIHSRSVFIEGVLLFISISLQDVRWTLDCFNALLIADVALLSPSRYIESDIAIQELSQRQRKIYPINQLDLTEWRIDALLRFYYILFFGCGIAIDLCYINAEQSALLHQQGNKRGKNFRNAIRIQIKAYGAQMVSWKCVIHVVYFCVSFFPPFRFQTIFAEKRKAICFPCRYRERERSSFSVQGYIMLRPWLSPWK